MKAKLSIAIIIIFLSFSASINAQTSELTYQGRLTDNSSPANGTYQMRFSLFNDPFGGTQDGSTIEKTNVQVTNGVFTVELDFGSNPFPFGENRYLQIEVRRNSGESYTPLNPRQQVTTSPYAIRTLIANAAENSFRLGNVDANQYVQTNDTRLSDARPPTSGSGFYIQNGTATQAGADFDISGTGEAGIFNARTQFNFNGSRILSSPGTNNTFVGINTGTDLNTGERNTFIGRDSGANTTTGNRNTFTGSGSGFENIGGSDNSFFGFNSGLRITSGIQNSFFGVSAGSGNLTGQNNAFFGYEAGLLATNSANTFVGAFAGRQTTSGAGNTFFGYNAGRNNQTGGENTFIGNTAGNNTTTGSNNTIVGNTAGGTNITGSNNTIIGADADVGNNDLSYATAIGSGASVLSDNTIVLGRNVDNVRVEGGLFIGGLVRLNLFGSAGTTDLCRNSSLQISGCSSSLRYKTNLTPFNSGLEIIRQLQPISYDWKKSGMRDIGFGAEDVEKIAPLFITYNEDGQVEGVKYKLLSVLFVNAFKEQQTKIERQTEENKHLKSKIETLETELDEQKRQFESLRLLVCADKPEAKICRAEKEEKKNEK